MASLIDDVAFGNPVDTTAPSTGEPLFEERDLAAALLAGMADEHVLLSEPAEVRNITLRALHGRADGNRREPFVPAADALVRLAQVAASSPNAKRAVEIVYLAAALSRATGTGLRVPPLLLHGPPGSGKTLVAKSIVAALGLPLEFVSGASMSDAGQITGYGPAWRNAGMGRVAKGLIAAPTLALAMVWDEVDKVGNWIGNGGQATIDAVLPLLEPSTAATWEDDYLGVPMRADGVMWLMTCNSLDPLGPAFRDRCIVVDVPGLDGAGLVAALDAIMDEVARESRMPAVGLSAAAAALLVDVPLRRARTVLRVALGIAVTADRQEVEPGDVRSAVHLVGASCSTERRIGFVR